jgi:hypothetical protein
VGGVGWGGGWGGVRGVRGRWAAHSSVVGDGVCAGCTHCALGWLVLFFPTKQLPHTPPEQAGAGCCLWG